MKTNKESHKEKKKKERKNLNFMKSYMRIINKGLEHYRGTVGYSISMLL
jgi:hypothetical protein